MAETGRLFIYVLIITSLNLIKVVRPYLNYLETACGGVDHCHAGKTNIIINDSTARLLLSYRLTICNYQVYMYLIPRI